MDRKFFRACVNIQNRCCFFCRFEFCKMNRQNTMKYQIISLLALFLFLSNTILAQDTIMLMRGKRLCVSDAAVGVNAKGDTILTYQYKGKQRHKSVSKIFSVSNASGERVFYTQEFEDDLTISQMRSFLQGQADFRKGFCWWAFAGGVASVGAAAAIPPIEFDDKISGSIPVGIIVPFGYLGVLMKTSKSEEKLISKLDFPGDEYYLMGAQYAISQQRFRSGLLGVLTGGVVWLTISAIND